MTKVIGVPNALCAIQCMECGFDHLYVSGGQLHAFEYGYADLNILSINEIVTAVSKISRMQPRELWVDIDAGECSNLKLARNIEMLAHAGASGVQIEDQPLTKRCGHREGKSVIQADVMCKKLQSIKESHSDLKVIARTDALYLEQENVFYQRLQRYVDAGADIIFIEAMNSIEQLQEIKKVIEKPILVNRTEFGKTPNLCDRYWEIADYHLLPITLSRIMHGAVSEALKRLSTENCQEDLKKIC